MPGHVGFANCLVYRSERAKMKMPVREKRSFTKEIISANFMDPSGESVERLIESRRHPIPFRTCRITLSRSQEKEAGTESIPAPPPNAADTCECPFCVPQIYNRYYQQNRSLLFSDDLAHERQDNNRYIGTTGDWEWMARKCW